ncbi:MAG: PIN domain-containing protein [Dissulfurispiraceae bacterium]
MELLALAMKLNVPVWTNDNDFKHSGIEVFTTARLLKALKL